jgi:hypothetical protein
MIGDIPRAGLWRERHPTAMRRDSTEYVPWQELMRTNGSYLNRLVHSMESQFAAAVKRGDEEWLQKNRDVWKASCEERDVHRTARGPFTRSWLDKKYGYGMTRPIPRFGVLQGESGRVTMRHVRCIMRPPGATKWWQTCHTICKAVAMEIRDHIQAGGRAGSPMSEVGGAKEDIPKAYRTMASRDVRLTMVALVNPKTGKIAFWAIKGSNFGLASSVPQFCRKSEAVCGILRAYLAWHSACIPGVLRGQDDRRFYSGGDP